MTNENESFAPQNLNVKIYENPFFEKKKKSK